MKAKIAELIGNFVLWVLALILRILRAIVVAVIFYWSVKIWNRIVNRQN